MPRTTGGYSYITLPDTGREQPTFYRFRDPFTKFSISQKGGYPIVSSKDTNTVAIKFYPYDGLFLNNNFIIKGFNVGIEWVRIETTWYGFEFDLKTVTAIREIEKMSHYLRTRDILKQPGIKDKVLKKMIIEEKKQYDRIRQKYFGSIRQE